MFSKTLERADWAETTIARGDLAEQIARLKREPGQPLVEGCAAVGDQVVTRLGLIDEYRLYVHPVALGGGLPLFGERVQLKLMDSRTFATGVVASRLVPA